MIKLQHAKSFIVSVSLFGAMLVCGPPSFPAQTPSPIVVDVPFEFIVNGKTLPAGKYRVHRAAGDSGRVLYINKVGSGEGISFATNAAVDLAAPSQPQLLFHHYGSEHYLAEVCIGSNHIGYRLPMSKAEQATASAEKPDQSKGTTQPGQAAGPGKLE